MNDRQPDPDNTSTTLTGHPFGIVATTRESTRTTLEILINDDHLSED